jgi:periplasmic protein TonB
MFEPMRSENRNMVVRMMSMLLSAAVHTAIIGTMIIVPMVFTSALQTGELFMISLAPPRLPTAPQPPVPPVAGKPELTTVVSHGKIDYAPPAIPEGIDVSTDHFPGLPADADYVFEGVMTGIPLPGQRPEGGVSLRDLLPAAGPPQLAPPERPVEITPMRVGVDIQASKLIVRVDPLYPEIARRTRTTGTVELDAVIDEEGNVSALRLVSGHPFLADAAMKAVARWKYSPTILNGEPVPVTATIKVRFLMR